MIPVRNDAQHAFLSIIESLDPAETTEIVIQDALHGTLNLSALGNAGFKRIETIRFLSEGELTALSNVPDTVTTLEIPNQRLTQLEHLPTKLLHLNAAYNDLTHWSATSTPHLQKLNLSHNRLETLTDLPASLLELECNNNVLKRLDLSETVVLAKLHCRENPLLTIERLPPTASADLEYDSTPFLDISYQGDADEDDDGAHHSSISSNKDVVIRKRNFNLRVCLQRYFELKQKYEEDVRRRRREAKEASLKRGMSLTEAVATARKVEPQCPQCGHAHNDVGDGRIFRQEKQHYYARCHHCELHIDIFMGDHDSLSTLVEEFHEHMEDSKQAIIEQKMQTLFGYLDKTHSVELFKMNMDTYKEVSENCKEFLAKYKHVYDNPERKTEERDMLERVLALRVDVARLLRRYRETGDRALLRQAMSDHVHQLVPAARALQRHLYPHMWVEAGEEDQKLTQRRHAFQDDDVVYGEPARVIQFQDGSSRRAVKDDV